MKRRQFLGTAGLAAAAPLAAAPQLQPQDNGKIGDKPAMKITDIKTFLIGTAGRNAQGRGGRSISGRNWLYVKVETDQGISGIGEAYSVGPDEATVKIVYGGYARILGGIYEESLAFTWLRRRLGRLTPRRSADG